jgi:uncharacterized membrane protein (DUF2068 family)
MRVTVLTVAGRAAPRERSENVPAPSNCPVFQWLEQLALGREASTLARMAARTRRGLMLIGVLKLLKGLALVIAGVGVLSLLHRDAAETVRHWIESVRIDPHDHLIDHLLGKIAGVSPRTLRHLGVGTLLYAAVFCTEGVGLLTAQHWAEYMTAGVTTSFLPLEVYELVVHPSLLKALVILANVAVVVYLVLEIRKERALRRSELASAPAATAATPDPAKPGALPEARVR